MAAAPLDEAVLRRAVAAVISAGSVSAAARATGIHRATLQGQIRSARARWPGCLPEPSCSNNVAWAATAKQPEYDPPELVSEDEDLDALIERQIEEHARRQKARASAEWMPFTVHGNEPFALVFVGDPHSDTCDLALLREHVSIIEKTPRMWAVGLGDYLNAGVGRLRGQYAHQSMTERDGFRVARWLLTRDIWWALILGNHDGERWHGQGSPLRWMENASATPPQEWQIKFSVNCGSASWRIWAAHNFPGNSGFNRNHGLDKRALQTGAMADLFVAGDRHVFKLSQDQHEHTGRVYWSARAKGYKGLDTYALEHGFGEQSVGHSIGAVFDPRTGKLVCFSDVAETAAYLTFLRLRQIEKVAA